MNEFEEKVVYEAIKDEFKSLETIVYTDVHTVKKIIEWNDANYNPEESTYNCQKCKDTFEESEFEALSMFEILEEMFIAFRENTMSNISIVIGSWGSYKECNERALGSEWLDLKDFDGYEEI